MSEIFQFPSDHMVSDNRGESKEWPGWVWFLIGCSALAILVASDFIRNDRPPMDEFWLVGEDAWLGFAGSVISAAFGGIVAGLILRAQLVKQEEHLAKQLAAQARDSRETANQQSRLQKQALEAQREESRRTREIEVLIELIPHVRERVPVGHMGLGRDWRSTYTQLSFRWEMNSGLPPEQASQLPEAVVLLMRMVPYARTYAGGKLGPGYIGYDDAFAPLPPDYYEKSIFGPEVVDEIEKDIADMVAGWMKAGYQHPHYKAQFVSKANETAEKWSDIVGFRR